MLRTDVLSCDAHHLQAVAISVFIMTAKRWTSDGDGDGGDGNGEDDFGDGVSDGIGDGIGDEVGRFCAIVS